MPKFLQNVGADVELNRVQNNVAEALRLLENSLLTAIDTAIDAIPAPANTTSPVAFVFGLNALQNALRFMTPGMGMETIDMFVPIPVAGNLTSLQVKMMTPMSSAAMAAVTFTVRKTPPWTVTPVPVNTALVVSFTAASGGLYEYGISTGSVAVSVGDLLSVSVLDVNYGSGSILAIATVELTPT